MVFSTTNLFKNTACPEGAACKLTNCIFGHDARLLEVPPTSTRATISDAAPTLTSRADEANEPVLKKRKITYNSLAEKPPSRADLIRSQLAASKGNSRTLPQDTARLSQPPASLNGSSPPTLKSLSKPVTPPATNKKATSGAVAERLPSATANKNNNHNGNAPEKVESLNPRLVGNDPVGHSKRQLFLKHLHAEIQRLDQQLQQATEIQEREKFHLSPQQLITMALDLEQKIVHESGPVYSNILKQRIAAFKKMTLDDWMKEVRVSFIKDESPTAKTPKQDIDTGLPKEQEYLLLPQLVADQKPLAAFGYVPTPPTVEEAAKAKAAVEASQNWEECDRCSARFQVFPDRNAAGLLVGNGPCKFHPNRKVFPQRSKADKETGPKEPYYPCCSENVGAPGCTTNDDHVFKTSSPARLAAILPFVNTPENPSPAKCQDGQAPRAVTFDCEMGYTVLGLELIRMTAVAWPSGEPLVDVLVRPLGAVIDLNSRFSGVFPEHYTNAVPYDQWTDYVPPPPSDNHHVRLPMVETPQKARDLLCRFLTPETPLIGHAIDNDLNTIRLCHPTIIDTIVLFPHPRGLPMRFGLKMLSNKHLHRSIQTGGSRGHDSLEDAVATGDLVRVKVGMKWKELQRQGYKIIEGNRLLPPPKTEAEDEDRPASPSEKSLVDRIMGPRETKRKRRRRSSGATTDESSENGGNEPPGRNEAPALTL